jgi:acyl carrier protein
MTKNTLPRDPTEHSATFAKVVSVLEDLTQDWDIEDPIRSETRVVADLGFESIDLIQMVGALEKAFRLRSGSLVDILVADGRYVDDLSVGEIAEAIELRVLQRAGG